MAKRMLIAALVAAVAGFAAALAIEPGSASTRRGTIGERSFVSHAIRSRLRFAVYLPPGYAAGRGRYPVVYYLHGLPANADAFRTFGFVPSVLDRLRLRAIVVAPQGARDGDSDPEYLDWGPGRNWETAIAEELPAFVDAHYRTIPGRNGRALIGVSAGGYGAFLLTLHHLASFGAVESWSGYFHPTTPDGTKPLRLGSAQADERANAHALVSDLRASIRRYPTLLGFYVGSGDTRFRQENVALDEELSAARVPHTFRIYPGAHTQQLWQREAGAWLALALRRLRPPSH